MVANKKISHSSPAPMQRKISVRWFFSFLFVVGLLLPLSGKVQAEGKSCLWKIRSGANVVYLLGSVHLLKEDNYPLAGAIEQAFEDAEKLVLEIDFSALDPAGSQKVMLEKGLYQDGKTLQGSLSEEAYAMARKAMKESGMDIQTLNRFEPWFVALTIMNLKLRQLGYNPNHGIDVHFFNKAKNSQMEVLGLETFEFQMDLLDKLSADTQESMLLQTLSDLQVIEKELHTLVRSWASGNTESLASLLLGTFKEYPAVYRSLIVDRNRSWLPRIEQFLAEDKNFMVVVGAGHLVGEDGIIALLREKGYAVEQL